MSRVINGKLTTIEEKLGDIEKAVLAGKRAISYALKDSGVGTTSPYTDSDQTYLTFKEYANLIKALAHTPLMMEVNVADGTAYKRTVVLPINFNIGSGNYIYDESGTQVTLNTIADEIIAANKDLDVTRLSKTNIGPLTTEPEGDSLEGHIVYDVFGNKCVDGEWNPITEEIGEYLTDEQQEEMLAAMDELGIDAGAPKVMNNGEGIYDYTVDWGDGSEICTFTPGEPYEVNKAAIWHTYEPGIYDITVTGDFGYVSSTQYYNGTNRPANRTNSAGTENIYDNDGVEVKDLENYGMYTSLTRIISWGHMNYTNLNYGFCHCIHLTEIPMYDTTNAFSDVTTFAYAFANCSALTSLPYNSNTDTGLFSDCDKVTSFAYAFAYCTGITGSIPSKFMDGCSAVTSVAGMFEYGRLSGALPSGLFAGMTSLTNASEAFAASSGYSVINGELSEDLFKDCPIQNLYRTFYNNSGITGKITGDMFGQLNDLRYLRQCFYNCTGITSIDADAFHNLSWGSTSEGLNCRQAFYGCTGIQEIPKGLFEGMTADEALNAGFKNEDGSAKYPDGFSGLSGNGLLLENMFEACTGIENIPSTALTNLKVANARGLFGGCTGIKSALPDAPVCGDWDNLSTMEKWYGAFGNCRNMSDASNIPFELGGQGERKFSDGQVGKICVSDNGAYTFYEPTEYYSDEKLVDGTPVGIVYADVVLDKSRCVPTLSSALSRAGTNTADDSTAETDREHKLLVCMLNDTTCTWTDTQTHREDIDTITNTSTVTVAYSYFYWDSSGEQTKQYQRYNGEAYSKAINEFVVTNGYMDNMPDYPSGCSSYSVVTELPSASSASSGVVYYIIESGTCLFSAYVLDGGTLVHYSDYDFIPESTRYPAITQANEYVTTTSSVSADNPGGECFLPDACDLWDQFCQRDWFADIITNRIVASGTHTSSTALPVRTGTYYWASAEYSQTYAWILSTNYATVTANNGKTNSRYVRPSLAIAL